MNQHIANSMKESKIESEKVYILMQHKMKKSITASRISLTQDIPRPIQIEKKIIFFI